MGGWSSPRRPEPLAHRGALAGTPPPGGGTGAQAAVVWGRSPAAAATLPGEEMPWWAAGAVLGGRSHSPTPPRGPLAAAPCPWQGGGTVVLWGSARGRGPHAYECMQPLRASALSAPCAFTEWAHACATVCMYVCHASPNACGVWGLPAVGPVPTAPVLAYIACFYYNTAARPLLQPSASRRRRGACRVRGRACNTPNSAIEFRRLLLDKYL